MTDKHDKYDVFKSPPKKSAYSTPSHIRIASICVDFNQPFAQQREYLTTRPPPLWLILALRKMGGVFLFLKI